MLDASVGNDFDFVLARREEPAVEDFGPKSALSAQEGFGSCCNSLIHPIARRTLLGALEPDARDLKFLADQVVQVDSLDKYVPPEVRRRCILFGSDGPAKFFKNLPREKGDLTFVIALVIEIAVTHQSASSHAFHCRNGFHRMGVRGLAVPTFEIVPIGNKDVPDPNRTARFVL